MKKNKSKIILLLLFITIFTCGCTKQLKDKDDKVVSNNSTGQNLTENILCQPTDPTTRNLYTENGVDLNSLPECKNYSVIDGGYEGVWTSIFVKPLAWLIIKIGNIVKSYGFGLILASLLIRFVVFPFTKKTAMQSELINKAKPELDRLEKKYENKTDNESMMKKSQEMSLIYKKYNINPILGCLFALFQLPLFIAFLEAINRTPAIFEENFLGMHLGTTPMVAITSGKYLYIILTIIVGLSTYFSLTLNSSSNADNKQMKTMSRVMLIMILFTSVFMSSALNIYWITTNLFTIVQNLIVKREKV